MNESIKNMIERRSVRGYKPDMIPKSASHGSNPDFQALPEAAVSQPVSQPHAADHRQKSSASLFLVNRHQVSSFSVVPAFFKNSS